MPSAAQTKSRPSPLSTDRNSSRPNPDGEGADGQSDKIELRLGLSLDGRFGTDRSSEAKQPWLARSSSIPSICSVSVGDGDPSPAAPLPPLRTCSLPTEIEEERWHRREMQSRRRMEARWKRLERRSSMGSSSSGLGKPDREDGGDVINGFQLRRSIGSQGSINSANAWEEVQLQGSARKIQPREHWR